MHKHENGHHRVDRTVATVYSLFPRRFIVRLALLFTTISCVALYWNGWMYQYTFMDRKTDWWFQTQKILEETLNEDFQEAFVTLSELDSLLVLEDTKKEKYTKVIYKNTTLKTPPPEKDSWPKLDESPFQKFKSLQLLSCWKSKISRKERNDSNGFLSLNLEGPGEMQRIQIAEALVLAYEIGASLIIPSVKEAKTEPASSFPELYSVHKFSNSFGHAVAILPSIPEPFFNLSSNSPLFLPFGMNHSFIQAKVKPHLKRVTQVAFVPPGMFEAQNSTFQTQVNRSNSIISWENSNFNGTKKNSKFSEDPLISLRCLATFKSLGPGPELERLAKRVVERMREAASGTGGKFVAIDLNLGKEMRKECKLENWRSSAIEGENMGFQSKEKDKMGEWKMEFLGNYRRQMEYDLNCPISPLQVAELLKALGFGPKTAIYVTVDKWHHRLKPIEEKFPLLITKEYSVPLLEEFQTVAGKTVMESLVDFLVCSQADVFLPANPGLFQDSVVAERLLSGQGGILHSTSLSLYNGSIIDRGEKAELLKELHQKNRERFIGRMAESAVALGYPEATCICEEHQKKRISSREKHKDKRKKKHKREKDKIGSKDNKKDNNGNDSREKRRKESKLGKKNSRSDLKSSRSRRANGSSPKKKFRRAERDKPTTEIKGVLVPLHSLDINASFSAIVPSSNSPK